MKTLTLERNRQLKVWNGEKENELYFEVGVKGKWKDTSHSIGFFNAKEDLFNEMTAYFYNEELQRLLENKRFMNMISILN